MKCFIYHFTSILHGLIRTHKWPAPNVSGFIAQVVRASHRYREVTGSNPVRKSWLFQASIRSCLNCVRNCDDHSSLEILLSWIKCKRPGENSKLCLQGWRRKWNKPLIKIGKPTCFVSDKFQLSIGFSKIILKQLLLRQCNGRPAEHCGRRRGLVCKPWQGILWVSDCSRYWVPLYRLQCQRGLDTRWKHF